MYLCAPFIYLRTCSRITKAEINVYMLMIPLQLRTYIMRRMRITNAICMAWNVIMMSSMYVYFSFLFLLSGFLVQLDQVSSLSVRYHQFVLQFNNAKDKQWSTSARLDLIIQFSSIESWKQSPHKITSRFNNKSKHLVLFILAILLNPVIFRLSTYLNHLENNWSGI